MYIGNPTAKLNIRNKDDNHEADDYLLTRYVSAHEAAWRIFGFKLTAKSPAVQALCVHLPGEDIRRYGKNNFGDCSTLLRYLFMRPTGEDFDELTYVDYFEKYILKKKPNENLERDFRNSVKNYVHKRNSHSIVGRIQSVMPRQGELFYLRLLLIHKPARSFEELRTVANFQHETFQSAAQHYGLLEASDEGHLTMREAVEMHRAPSHLRFLFVILACDGCPAQSMWQFFKNDMMIDFLIESNQDERRALSLTLCELQSIFGNFNKSLEDLGLPLPDYFAGDCSTDIFTQPIVELNGNLNSDQVVFKNKIMNILYDHECINTSKTRFLQGKGMIVMFILFFPTRLY